MSSALQLRLAHCLVLAAFAGWLAASQVDGWKPALIVGLLTATGEWLPRGTWRELGTPVLAMVSAALGWWVGGNSPGALHALLGTLVAALVLIPARPGVLRLIAPLCAFELVILGLPGFARPPVWAAIATLVPLACIALAMDAWLQASVGARANSNIRQHRLVSLLRWVLMPAALAALIGVVSYIPTERIVDTFRQRPLRTNTPSAIANEHAPNQPRPGGSISRERDVSIDAGRPPPRDTLPAARLLMPDNPSTVVYLRAAACSRLVRDVGTGHWRWSPAPGEVQLLATTPPAGLMQGDVVRLAGLGDIVHLPDDGDWAQVDDVWLDGDGNRWRPGLGDAVRSYRVVTNHQPRRELPADLALAQATCRELPPAIAAWPWGRIERPRWRDLPPEAAAEAIAVVLRGHCGYDLELPAGQSEPVATFLFANDPMLRRGTCEYFAGAAALLLRRSGHAARCVTGYASAEWDGSGILFRGIHAHAWVEVLSADGRWIRSDPTPPVAFALATKRIDPADSTRLDPHQAVALQPSPNHGLLFASIGTGGVLLVLALIQLRRRRHNRSAPGQRDVRKRSDELVQIARNLKIPLEPHDTARVICGRLTQKTGIDLSSALAAYEQARFGDGIDPGPWPAGLRRHVRA